MIVFITAITITADIYPALKVLLKETFGHHWIGKSVLATILWLAFALIPIKSDFIRTKHIVFTAMGCALAIFAFYVLLFIL
ncbi:hypothetical protein D4Q76_01700 [archaeon]|nr:MAG: hypothetical protein D4Q76_01700 [archaeon]